MCRRQKWEQKLKQQIKTVRNMIDNNLTISIITLNINVLNIPIRRQRLSEWI